MPKLLILFHSRRPDVVELAEAAVEGARRVRFAEVDLRRLPDTDDASTSPSTGATGGRDHRPLAHAADLTAYDGLILVVSDAEASAALSRTIAATDSALTNRVGSALTPAGGSERSAVLWSALTPMADRGMILVPANFGAGAGEPADAARRLGARVAEVIGWVTHARSHHHDHGHAVHGHQHEQHE